MIRKSNLAYSVERIAYSKSLSASRKSGIPPKAGKRYPLNAKRIGFIFAFCILHFNCYAQSISSTELINNARQYDGKTVTYTGEVIGEVMLRAGYAWVNANDGLNAIGVWVLRDFIKDILYAGGYKTIGDTVEITGVFHNACPDHGGDLDIHAESLRKIQGGKRKAEQINPRKQDLSLLLLGVLCSILILKQFKRK